MPLVSFLVTVFNRESYLEDCLGSILRSRFTDSEIIVVDDDSTDDSVEIARKLAEKDDRIQVHENPVNLGDYANRNRAASFASGKYLKYLDADDLIYPHSLELMVEAMERHPEAALGLSLNQIDPDQPYPFLSSTGEVIRNHFRGRSVLGVGPSASIIRRDAFEEIGGFSGRQFIGDAELWFKLAERWPVVSLPPALVWWRRHEGQQMNLEMSRPEVLGERFRLEVDTATHTQWLDDSERKTAIRRVRQHHARRILALATKGRKPKEAMQLARDSGLSIPEFLRGFRPYQ